MDLQQLCGVLTGCLSANQEERAAAEAILKQVGVLLSGAWLLAAAC